MKQAEDTLLAGFSNRRSPDELKRLFLLNEHANAIFLEALEISLNKNIVLPPELGQSVRALAGSIASKTKNEKKILQPDQMTEEVEELFMKIYNADAIMNEPVQKIDQAATISKPSLKTIFLGALDKIQLSSALPFDMEQSLPLLPSSHIPPILTVLLDFLILCGRYVGFDHHRHIPSSGSKDFRDGHRSLLASLILAAVHNEFIIVLIILCYIH